MAKLTTGVVRLSYANIAQPRKNDDGKAKYSSQIIIDKTDKKTIKAFERAIEELKADPKAVAKVEGKAAYLKLNLRDGDTDEAVVDQPETYAGKYFINANSDKQPIVFTRDKIKWMASTSKKKSTLVYTHKLRFPFLPITSTVRRV